MPIILTHSFDTQPHSFESLLGKGTLISCVFKTVDNHARVLSIAHIHFLAAIRWGWLSHRSHALEEEELGEWGVTNLGFRRSGFCWGTDKVVMPRIAQRATPSSAHSFWRSLRA